jgi:hypothetical protein
MQLVSLCGRVSYKAAGEPAFTAMCHCRSCQRYTGSAFEPIIAFRSQDVKVQGELKTFDEIADSGKAVHRRFCPNCGSGMVAEVEVMPGLTLVLAGSLDDPSIIEPSMEVFCSSAADIHLTSDLGGAHLNNRRLAHTTTSVQCCSNALHCEWCP